MEPFGYGWKVMRDSFFIRMNFIGMMLSMHSARRSGIIGEIGKVKYSRGFGSTAA